MKWARAGSANPRVLCVGPGEWLLVADGGDAVSLRNELRQDLERQGLVMVDLSQGLAVLRVEGVAARDLLSKGCGLDLHPNMYGPQQCVTNPVRGGLQRSCAGSRVTRFFELWVARSHVAYVHQWLMDAAVELTAVEPSPFAL